MGEADQIIYGGVDTHRDVHVAAVVDGVGRVLGSESFAVEESGYRRMVTWFESRGQLVRVGVEGTGSYGAGLARYYRIRALLYAGKPNWDHLASVTPY